MSLSVCCQVEGAPDQQRVGRILRYVLFVLFMGLAGFFMLIFTAVLLARSEDEIMSPNFFLLVEGRERAEWCECFC